VRARCATVLLLVATISCSDGSSSSAPTTRTPPPTGPVPSAGCERPPVAEGVSDGTLTSRGVERRYQLTVPDGYDGRDPLPVVLGLHPLSITHLAAAGIAGFADAARDHDFVAVAPSGRIDGTTPFWMAMPLDDGYDVAFIDDLLSELEATLCIDTARVFATGMSNGGHMSSALACRLPERVTAVAPVAGAEFFDSCADGPVPVIAFHGTADPIVTYDGGGLNARTIADTHHWKGDVPDGLPRHAGVDAAMQAWAEHNGCDPDPVERRVAADVRRRSWRGCEADTVLYVVEGGGHAWPGRPEPAFEASFGRGTTSIDATSLIFEFFFGHPSN
jgi:polyhydroxybutyrate depolymerase